MLSNFSTARISPFLNRTHGRQGLILKTGPILKISPCRPRPPPFECGAVYCRASFPKGHPRLGPTAVPTRARDLGNDAIGIKYGSLDLYVSTRVTKRIIPPPI